MVVNRKYLSKNTADKVHKELEKGLDLLNEIDKPIITFFGSHKGKPGEKYYDAAKNASKELVKKGYAIMSGGGPGIMHAANSGAKEVKGESIGIVADMLSEEKMADNIFTHKIAFDYMFVRRFILAIKSDALIFFPGGYGTFNELFEYIVLMQTKMVEKVPILLYDEDFWKKLDEWNDELVKKEYIKKSDLKLFKSINDIKELIKSIK
ncbi:MAG: TIGR00730 family Rossman fold protein [Nanobdellota archaeon]